MTNTTRKLVQTQINIKLQKKLNILSHRTKVICSDDTMEIEPVSVTHIPEIDTQANSLKIYEPDKNKSVDKETISKKLLLLKLV